MLAIHDPMIALSNINAITKNKFKVPLFKAQLKLSLYQ